VAGNHQEIQLHTVFKTLRTVIYKVNNLQAAKEWYIQMTGLQPYFDQPFYVGFDINGCELGLDPDMAKTAAGNQAVAYWAVDDIHAVVKKLSGSGAIVIQPPTNVGGTIEVATIQDPFGNHVGFIEGA